MKTLQDQHSVEQTFTGNLTAGKIKLKRTRKPWVYKHKYDELKARYKAAKIFALIGRLSLITLTISMILLRW